MALSTTIDNGYQLEQLFEQCGRANHFSHEGYNALYDYLNELSEDMGEDLHVDVIALCCDFTEYESWEALYNEYTYSYNKEEESWEDTNQGRFIDWVYDRTIVIETKDYKDSLVGVIVQCF